MIDGQTILNIREINSYQDETLRSLKDRVRLLETQEFPFVRHRDFDAKGDLIVGSADNTYDNLAVGVTNGFVIQVDNTQTLGIKWGTIPTAGITDASVTNAKLDNMAQATVKGRAVAAGTGVPVDLTATQLNAIVGTANLSLSLASAKITVNAPTGNPSLELAEAGSGKYGLYYNVASNYFAIGETGVADHLVIADGGNVGIGKTPATKFDVDGAVAATSYTAGGVAVPTISSSSTLTNKTLTSPVIATIVNGAGTLTLPSSTDTLVGRATTDTLTNKTLTSPSLTTPTVTGAGAKLTIDASSSNPALALSQNGVEKYGLYYNVGGGYCSIGETGVADSIIIYNGGAIVTVGNLTVGDDLTVTDLLTVGTFGAWTNATYSTGWSTTAGHTDARYRKVGDVVEIEGTVAYAGGVGSNQIFVLPSGFRPAASKNYPADAATITGGRVAISTSGSVTMQEPSVGAGAQTYFTLDGIRFSTL